MRGPDPQFEERPVAIEKQRQAFAHRQPPMTPLPPLAFLAAALAKHLLFAEDFIGNVAERAHARGP
jgi:hypothetical protein